LRGTLLGGRFGRPLGRSLGFARRRFSTRRALIAVTPFGTLGAALIGIGLRVLARLATTCVIPVVLATGALVATALAAALSFLLLERRRVLRGRGRRALLIVLGATAALAVLGLCRGFVRGRGRAFWGLCNPHRWLGGAGRRRLHYRRQGGN
jgi:hypothetical protein